MAHRYFRASVASYDIVNAQLTTLIQVGDGTWLGTAGATATRPIYLDLVYWPHNFDAEGVGSQIEKETFACYYVTGALAPEYTPPEDIEEVTQQDFITARDAAFPPVE
jgi:hypothetical protein